MSYLRLICLHLPLKRRISKGASLQPCVCCSADSRPIPRNEPRANQVESDMGVKVVSIVTLTHLLVSAPLAPAPPLPPPGAPHPQAGSVLVVVVVVVGVPAHHLPASGMGEHKGGHESRARVDHGELSWLTAAIIPMENPCCSCKLAPYSCSPYGESLLQL